MDDGIRTPFPIFLIDDGLWNKFNTELRAACHWCTHHHTTTPAEAARRLERGEGWPRDWLSRKVKNSSRQNGGLFICPAPDCPGHINTKGERRRRWFCRFCINRHLGVDLKNFFQLDEVQNKWVQLPNLTCWHCRARVGDGICVNCPQKHTKKGKRIRDAQGMIIPRTVLNPPPQLGGVGMALLSAAGDMSYDGTSSEGKCHIAEAQSVDESSFPSDAPQLGIPSQPNNVSDLQFITTQSNQRVFFSEKAGESVPCEQGMLDGEASTIPSFLSFLNKSCTPFHATSEARRLLIGAGFQQLDECHEWELQTGGRYFFIRNMLAIYAFAVGRKYKPGEGFHIIVAHTDSPCLKMKSLPSNIKNGFLQPRVKTYGNGLWNTWYDRDLSVAGRIVRRKKSGELVHELVQVTRPILRIPSPSFHVDRMVPVGGSKSDAGAQISPILATQIEAELAVSCDSEASMQIDQESTSMDPSGIHHPLLLQAIANELQCDVSEIADFELNVYDMQPPCIGGVRDEFIFSGRLDNLASSFCALWALLDSCSEPMALSEETSIRMVSLFDNSEVAPEMVQAGGSQALFHTMMRIVKWLARDSKSEGVVERSICRSIIVAADMMHALHPNYVENEDDDPLPKLQDGLVIKTSCNQNHTDGISSFLFKEVAKRNCLPFQNTGAMAESGCSSTIDSILSAGYGMRVIDSRLPLLSMHSVREMCGTEDIETAFRHFKAFFHDISLLDEQMRVNDD